MTNTICLDMKNVGKTYKKEQIIKSFSLKVNRGEIVALLGKNGAGKSTIIKMIAGIIKPSEGEISIDGHSLKESRIEYAKKVAYMPDHFRFPQTLTVYEFVKFYSSLRTRNVQKMDSVLEMVGLSEKRKEKTSSLSKGMGQRLLLATLLLSDAQLLLLDEPTNGLDVDWVERFKEIMQMLKNEGRTVLFSTHDKEVAGTLSDFIVYI